ncbi:MAG: HIT family protein [Muribaculaceae bacterium]|nr:HIT family protein [Muribaculaceae bacterium]
MTIFSKIIAGEIPSYKVAEDSKFYAFLDINPISWGHTLVVPKKEVDYIFDLDDETLGEMMIFSKKVANAIKKAIPCRKVGMAVLGLEVPHAHIHLVPLKNEGDMDFKHKVENPSPEKMKETAEAISKCFSNGEK